MVDACDPALMFTIPRLAIVCGLLVLPDGPLNLQRPPSQLSELFRPFRNLLCKVRWPSWPLITSPFWLLLTYRCFPSMVPTCHGQLASISRDCSVRPMGIGGITSSFSFLFFFWCSPRSATCCGRWPTTSWCCWRGRSARRPTRRRRRRRRRPRPLRRRPRPPTRTPPPTPPRRRRRRRRRRCRRRRRNSTGAASPPSTAASTTAGLMTS